MNIFTEWIRNIVFITMTITLLNMIIPDNMGKYVKVISGFLVMLVIIKPFADFIHADITLDTLFAKHTTIMNQQQMETSGKVNTQDLNKNQDLLTLEVYKDKIQHEIQIKLSKEIGYDMEVSLQINEDLYSEQFGIINQATIIILDKISDETIVTIPKISIMDNEGEDKLEPEIAKKINNFFLNFYNLQSENISISKKNKTMGGDK